MCWLDFIDIRAQSGSYSRACKILDPPLRKNIISQKKVFTQLMFQKFSAEVKLEMISQKRKNQ